MFQELHENDDPAELFVPDDTPLSYSQTGATIIVPPVEEVEPDRSPLETCLLMRLFVRTGQEIQELLLPKAERYILGRVSPHSPHRPNVDLTDYQALQLGVSRLHAVIENHNNIFTITDLYSSNGTSLNGHHLQPNEIRFLHDGDTICLSKLVIYARISELGDE